MFSGGEKKSFYELDVVIGIIFTALQLKQTNKPSAKLSAFFYYPPFYAKKWSEVRFFPLLKIFHHDKLYGPEKARIPKLAHYRPLSVYIGKQGPDWAVHQKLFKISRIIERP
jgi:hypothetical protein